MMSLVHICTLSTVISPLLLTQSMAITRGDKGEDGNANESKGTVLSGRQVMSGVLHHSDGDMKILKRLIMTRRFVSLKVEPEGTGVVRERAHTFLNLVRAAVHECPHTASDKNRKDEVGDTEN